MKKFALIAAAAFGLLMLPAMAMPGSSSASAAVANGHEAATAVTTDMSARRWRRWHRRCGWRHGRRWCW